MSIEKQVLWLIFLASLAILPWLERDRQEKIQQSKQSESVIQNTNEDEKIYYIDYSNE